MSKQRLLEMMGRLDPNFKQKNIDEIGVRSAGVAISRNVGGDLRTKQISKDVITSLFSKYIGRDIPFFMKVSESDKPTKFMLTDAILERNTRIQTDYSQNDTDYVLTLNFFNENGEESDAPYAENRRNLTLTYTIGKDFFLYIGQQLYYNQYAVNLLLYAVMTIRKAYYHAFPIYFEGKLDTKATEEKMKTKLNKRSFQMFQFNSNDLENRSNIKPVPDETW